MNDLTIVKQNGGSYIDSRDVAALIGKRHDNLIRDIAGYLKTLEKSNVLKIEGVNFFVKNTYQDAKGEQRPCYLISRKGADVIANKLTGEKGVLFTAAYVTRFYELEASERAATIRHPRLGEFNAASRIIVRAMNDAGATPDQVVGFLRRVYEPLGITVTAEIGGKKEEMLSAYQIARKLGVYSLKGKPHFLAVASVLNDLDIDGSHKAIEPTRFGDSIALCTRYDGFAAAQVGRWLEVQGWPDRIQGQRCVYKVAYKNNNVQPGLGGPEI